MRRDELDARSDVYSLGVVVNLPELRGDELRLKCSQFLMRSKVKSVRCVPLSLNYV